MSPSKNADASGVISFLNDLFYIGFAAWMAILLITPQWLACRVSEGACAFLNSKTSLNAFTGIVLLIAVIALGTLAAMIAAYCTGWIISLVVKYYVRNRFTQENFTEQLNDQIEKEIAIAEEKYGSEVYERSGNGKLNRWIQQTIISGVERGYS